MRDGDEVIAAQVERALLLRDGSKVHRGGREILFSCVAHDDRHPSASYNRESGVWVCYACGAGGGLVWGDVPLAPILGLLTGEVDPIDMAEWDRLQEKRKAEQEAAEKRSRESLAAYWRDRRLVAELVRHGEVMRRLAAEGIGADAAEHFSLGYTTYSGTPALAIPWTVAGEVKALQYRLLEDSAGGRYRWHAGSKPTLYNADAVLFPHDDTILIVEGAKKAVCLWSHGVTSVCAIVNKGGWQPTFAKPFAAFERVVFMPDPDAVHEAQEAARTVTGARVARMPSKPDDLLVETGGDVDLLWSYVETGRLVPQGV